MQTGCQTNEIGELIAPDLEVYLKASNAPGKCYFKFRNPCSPHLDVKLEEESIDYEKLVEKIKADCAPGLTVIEGAGGLFVPLDGQKTFQDLIKDLNARVMSCCFQQAWCN